MVFEDGKIAEFPKIKKITKIPETENCPRGWQLCLLLERLAFISIFVNVFSNTVFVSGKSSTKELGSERVPTSVAVT